MFSQDIIVDSMISFTPATLTDLEFWQIISGAEFCHIVDGGRCVSDGEGDYGSNENCNIKVLRPLVVTATDFHTEAGYDILTVAGTQYYGSDGPQGLPLDAGAELVWTSDDSEFRSGFKVCAAEPGSVGRSMSVA